MQADERPFNVKEAAARLGMSEYAIRDWVAQRRIKFIRLGRSIKILPAEIQRLLEEGLLPPEPKRDQRRPRPGVRKVLR